MFAGLLIFACRGVPPDVPPSATIRSDRLVVAVVPGRQGFELAFRGGTTDVEIARLRGARLVLGDASGGRLTQNLPFASWAQPEPTELELTCATSNGHTVTVEVNLTDDAEAHVRVLDDVAQRSRIYELTLDYEWLDPNAPDRMVSPYRSHRPELLAGDLTFRTPITFVRRGAAALALVPDLDVLERDRRIAQGVEILRAPRRVRHGLISHRLADADAPAAFTRRGAAPTIVGAERLQFAHYVSAVSDATPHRTLATVESALWRRTVARALGRGDAVAPRSESNDSVFEQVVSRVTSAAWCEHSGVGGAAKAGSYSSRVRDAQATRADAWFGLRRQALRTAYAELRFAERSGATSSRAASVAELALSSPRRSGLVPSRFVIDAEGAQVWQPNDPAAPLPRHHQVSDAAVTALWLLELRGHLPDARHRIDELTGSLTRFLIQNQRASGSIPTFYDDDFLTPRRDVFDDRSPECGVAALFLARYAEIHGDPQAEVAAQRALRFLGASIHPEATWPDSETLTGRERPRDGVSGSLGLLYATRACFVAQALQPDAELIRLGAEFAERLASLQCVWSPNWIDVDLTGALRSDTHSLRVGDPRHALAADAFLRAYMATGRREFLQRGAVALRRGISLATAGWTPWSETPEDSNWGRTTALAIAERLRDELGQAVVDFGGGFAEGLDAVWFEDVVVDGQRCAFRLLTEARFDAPVRVVFRNVPRTAAPFTIEVNGRPVGELTHEELAAGITLEPQRVPRFSFRPPSSIQHSAIWSPHAHYEGPLRPGTKAWVEFAPIDADSAPERIPLEPSIAGTLSARQEPLIALDLGTEIEAELVVQTDDGRVVHVPTDRPRRIRIGSMQCVDPGDADEPELLGEQRTRIQRYATGREFARHIEPLGHATYRLPVAATAATLRLELDVTGAVHVTSGPHVLHDDDGATGARTIEIRLSDPRLWRTDDALLLRIEPSGADPCAVAQVRYASEGSAPIVTDLISETGREADSRIRVAVVPLRVDGAPLRTDKSSLERIFFGDAEYRLTPEPNPRLTSGSVAQLVDRASGGISELRGSVLAPLRGAVSDDPLRDVIDALRAHIHEHPLDALPSAVVCVHSGPRDFADDRQTIEVLPGVTVPVVFLSEESEDGSVLSSGTALLALLDRLYGLEPLGSQDTGNFGTLSLAATGGGHVPPRIAGLNLVRTGWAQFLRADPTLVKDNLLSVGIAPLERGRSVLRLPSAGLPGRGDLLIENCGQSSSDPWETNSGALFYRVLEPADAPTIWSGQARAEARILRLSATRPAWSTPFQPADPDDLFRSNNFFDDTSRDVLATLHGEVFWSLRRIRTERDGTTRLWLEYLAEHPLRDRSIAWQHGADGSFAPIPSVRERGLGFVETGDNATTIRVGEPEGSTVRGVIELPERDQPLRLFGRVESTNSSIELVVRVADETMRCLLEPRTDSFQFDMPAGRETRATIDFVRRGEGTATCRLTDLVVVPRTLPRFPIRLPTTDDVALDDGTIHGRAGRATIGSNGRQRLSIPIVAPSRDAVLIVRAGVRPGGDPVTLTARIGDTVLFEDATFEAKADRRALTTIVAHLPHVESVGTLELDLRGTPEGELHFVTLAIDD